MNRPTISVVVPVFNVVNHVKYALNSIRQQTCPPDEVIVIDDGSSDGSSNILTEFSHFACWHVIKTRNNGLGSARNLGRMLASSQYVYFFDSDDLLKSDFIAQMRVEIDLNKQPDMIMFSGDSFNDDGFKYNFKPSAYWRIIEGVFSPADCLLTIMSNSGINPSSPCLYVTKSELWSKNRLAFPTTLHEDEAVLFPLIALSEKTVVLKEIYFLRRYRKGSIMTSGLSKKNTAGVLHALQVTLAFMATNSSLIKPELAIWRSRVNSLGLRYVDLCQETGQPVAWGNILLPLFRVGGINYIISLTYCLSPNWLKIFYRATKRFMLRLAT